MFKTLTATAILICVSGYLFGRFRHYWEEGRSPDAYPQAVRISRRAGFLVAALFFIYEMHQSFGGRMAMLLLFAVIFLTPVAGFFACGLLRPFIYLGALFYYGRVSPAKTKV